MNRKITLSAVKAGLYLGYLYGCLFAFNAFLFKFGNRLPFPVHVREICSSKNYFDYTMHPQYRKWLKGFVMEPGKPWEYRFRGDTYQAFKVPEETRAFSLPVDEHGFIDTGPVQDAEVLIVGDSFVRSAGCNYEETIPSYFEKLSGLKTYNAGQAGYGWHHYLEILRRFAEGVDGAPAEFRGKTAYVLFYVGNDFSDMYTYKDRLFDEQHPKVRHYFELRTLRKMTALLINGMKNAARAVLRKPLETWEYEELDLDTRPYSNWKSSPGAQEITQDMTKGFYPHALNLEPYKDTPFAFNPYIRRFKTLDWLLDDALKADAREVFRGIKELADKTGISVRVVVIPTNAQVLRPYVADVHSPPRHLFDEIFYPAADHFDQLAAFAVNELKAVGLEVLDLKPVLQEGVRKQKLLWPGDTPFTPQGNEAAARAIAEKFHRPQ